MKKEGRTYPQQYCDKKRQYCPMQVISKEKKIDYFFAELDIFNGSMINDKDSVLNVFLNKQREKGDDIE